MNASRRRFLRGTGAALPLPFLPSLQAARLSAREPAPPVRSVFLFFPNGIWEPDWTPVDEGPNYTLSPTLQPLQPVRDDVLVLTGLDKRHSQDGGGHQTATANFLTGLPVHKTSGKNLSAGGISVDQLIAARSGDQTPVRNLVLGVEPVRTGVDRPTGITLLYTSLISWETADRPAMPQNSPRVVFDRLFGRSAAATPAARRTNARLLNLVLEDARRLRPALGRDDRVKLDEYLAAVEAVESRIRFAEKAATNGSPPNVQLQADIQAAPVDPVDFRARMATMFDVLTLALRADSTRVASMMLANDSSAQSFAFLGVPEAHHEVSHHQHDPRKVSSYQKINRWYVEQFAAFVQRLRNTPEGAGTLLDSTQVLFGSGLSDGNRHDPDNLPILLAGRHAGWPSGRHISCRAGSSPLCSLYLSMLQRHGIHMDQFGDGTQPLL
ncbi:MAG: DUF1552 domain-containing protein [Planctomycetota bacterium]